LPKQREFQRAKGFPLQVYAPLEQFESVFAGWAVSQIRFLFKGIASPRHFFTLLFSLREIITL